MEIYWGPDRRELGYVLSLGIVGEARDASRSYSYQFLRSWMKLNISEWMRNHELSQSTISINAPESLKDHRKQCTCAVADGCYCCHCMAWHAELSEQKTLELPFQNPLPIMLSLPFLFVICLPILSIFVDWLWLFSFHILLAPCSATSTWPGKRFASAQFGRASLSCESLKHFLRLEWRVGRVRWADWMARLPLVVLAQGKA